MSPPGRCFGGNVGLMFAYRVGDGLAQGIWSSAVLSTYVSVLMRGNQEVGIALAVQGTFLAATAIPAAWFATRFRKDTILRLLGLVQLLAIGTTSAALLNDSWGAGMKFAVLCVALALWGIAQGNTPVLDALLADSVQTGSRSRLYTALYVAGILSQGFGPAVASATLLWAGNEWNLEVMQQVMLLGMLVALCPMILLLFFNDDWALGPESDSVQRILQQQGGRRAQEPLLQPLLRDMEAGGQEEDGPSSWSHEVEQNLEGFEVSSVKSPEKQLAPGSSVEASPQRPGAPSSGAREGLAGAGDQPALHAEAAATLTSFALDLSDSLSEALSSRASSMTSLPPYKPAGSSFVGKKPSVEPAAAAGSSKEVQAWKAATGNLLEAEPDPKRPLLPVSTRGQPLQREAWGPETADSSAGTGTASRAYCWRLGPEWVPLVLALTDCVMSIASGMTIRFFPIFFKQEVHLPPSGVTLVYCAIPFTMSLFSYLAQRSGRLIGRMQTIVFNRMMGIIILFWISFNTDSWTRPAIMVPVYLLRTSFVNCSYPLQKSILMDFVRKESRAKWNSLEAVTAFGWSGSAALGGWLIEHYGFQLTFRITAALQLLGWLCSLVLLSAVPRKEMTAAELSAAPKLPRPPRTRA